MMRRNHLQGIDPLRPRGWIRSGKSALNTLLRTLLSAWLLALAVSHVVSAEAVSEPTTRITWNTAPIAIVLSVGTERRVHFPQAVKVGVPAPLGTSVRIQSADGTLYLLAHAPFGGTRVVVQGLDDGRVYLLDVSATEEGRDATSLTVVDARDTGSESDADAVTPRGARTDGYATLTRFAAQQLYAPSRLLHDLPGVVRVPVKREPVPLVRGDAVEAVPLVGWRGDGLFVTAVTLRNTTTRPQTLDPRSLRGTWLTATFQHNRVLAAGDAADRTVVYLISAQPFRSEL